MNITVAVISIDSSSLFLATLLYSCMFDNESCFGLWLCVIEV
jgi:hypothetical protein